MTIGTVFLIPTFLHPDGMHTLPAYLLDAVKQCSYFFVENEKTTRRFLKQWWPQMQIEPDNWFTIHKAEEAVQQKFEQLLITGNNIAIISEAGCPGVADPGQVLVAVAQKMGAIIKPLVGPNSILLALMGSGMNGQHFQFNGYLPVDSSERKKSISMLEEQVRKKGITQIFIETPYRNNQLIKDLLQVGNPNTKLCIAVNLTAENESIQTKTIQDWKKQVPDIHKQLAIFLLGL